MKHVAIFTNNFPVLSETFIINQIVGLKKLGVKVDVIANEKGCSNLVCKNDDLPTCTYIGLDSNACKLHNIFRALKYAGSLIFTGYIKHLLSVVSDLDLTPWQKLNLISCLFKMVKRPIKYDNVIVHFGINGYYVCKLRDLGLIEGPISTIFHGFDVSNHAVVDKYFPQYKKLFLKGDLMLPVSEYWSNKLVKLGCGIEKIKVHRMGVNIDEFEMKAIDSPLQKPLKVIQIGRLTEKKAILDSIRAIDLASKNFAIEFTIIGEGELLCRAQSLINSLGAQEIIRLIGPKPQHSVKGYLEKADVFLLPSVTAKNGDMEGIPVVLMEAMAKGLITISTKHSGIPELIDDSVSGFLVNEHSIDQIAECLLKIKKMTLQELINMRLKAYRICIEKYNNNILNQILLKLIE